MRDVFLCHDAYVQNPQKKNIKKLKTKQNKKTTTINKQKTNKTHTKICLYKVQTKPQIKYRPLSKHFWRCYSYILFYFFPHSISKLKLIRLYFAEFFFIQLVIYYSILNVSAIDVEQREKTYLFIHLFLNHIRTRNSFICLSTWIEASGVISMSHNLLFKRNNKLA